MDRDNQLESHFKVDLEDYLMSGQSEARLGSALDIQRLNYHVPSRSEVSPMLLLLVGC